MSEAVKYVCEKHGIVVFRGECPDCAEENRFDGRWEVIGPRECPLMRRLTLVSCRWFKVLVHRFEPNATDEAAHDHPRSFLTFVLRGGYDDLRLCPNCHGTTVAGFQGDNYACCYQEGMYSAWCQRGFIRDEVRAPAIRFRRADHAHITEVLPEGATTFVLMGPLRREWGFWKDGKWFEWRLFDRLFGLNWRCPD